MSILPTFHSQSPGQRPASPSAKQVVVSRTCAGFLWSFTSFVTILIIFAINQRQKSNIKIYNWQLVPRQFLPDTSSLSFQLAESVTFQLAENLVGSPAIGAPPAPSDVDGEEPNEDEFSSNDESLDLNAVATSEDSRGSEESDWASEEFEDDLIDGTPNLQ